MVATLGKNSEFAEVNIDNMDSLKVALSGAVLFLLLLPVLSSYVAVII